MALLISLRATINISDYVDKLEEYAKNLLRQAPFGVNPPRLHSGWIKARIALRSEPVNIAFHKKAGRIYSFKVIQPISDNACSRLNNAIEEIIKDEIKKKESWPRT